MLNLLPSQYKEAYRLGRINRHLVHWIVVCIIGIIGAITITASGYLYLDHTSRAYKKQADSANQQLASQNLTGIQSQVKEMSNNLNLVIEVLSKQVLFSDLLDRLTKLLPPNTNLTGISIAQTQGGIDITAAAKNYSDATQFQVNLTDSANELFSKADIVSINCSGTGDYPCTVILRALFSPQSPSMFTNNSK
ncbi:PilN domain-containing protein [Candidatus Saccharibacteria bacterium]|nr:PilN domain-containing protein [Candidatus Saccharibacteria bacterium]